MMKRIKGFFRKILFLLVLFGLANSIPCTSEALDLVDRDGPHGSALRQETKIPAGFVGDTVHYIIAPSGTPLKDIPFKITQEREKLGLSPGIPLDQHETLFQHFFWKPCKHTLVEFDMPAKVIEVFAQKGQHIQARDKLIKIETMKMEVDISSPSSGEVKDIFVKVGDIKKVGEQLLTLVSPSPNWEAIDPSQIMKDLLRSIFPWAIKPLPYKTHASPRLVATEAKEPVLVTTFPPILSASPLPGLPSPPASPPDVTQINGVGKALKSAYPTVQGPTEKAMAPHGENRDQNIRTEAPPLKKASQEAIKDFSQMEHPLPASTPVFKNENVNLDKGAAGFFPSLQGYWTGGLILLGSLIFTLKAIGYCNLTHVFSRKLAGALSGSVSLSMMDDFRVHDFITRQPHNMNRPPSLKRQAI